MKFSSNFLLLNINKTNLKNNKYDYFNLHSWFLFIFKKEKIYTKLKYSRVPQVDYVSGGVASLLAGLLGFLVTEKFGFELIDSLDFYILLYYIIIFLATCRVTYKVWTFWGILSLIKTYSFFLKFIRKLTIFLKKL